jgi:hypothetical protein
MHTSWVGSLGQGKKGEGDFEKSLSAPFPAVSIAKLLLTADPTLINFASLHRIFGSMHHGSTVGKDTQRAAPLGKSNQKGGLDHLAVGAKSLGQFRQLDPCSAWDLNLHGVLSTHDLHIGAVLPVEEWELLATTAGAIGHLFELDLADIPVPKVEDAQDARAAGGIGVLSLDDPLNR